jgi:predicted TIM-barrel enzyme
MPTAQPVLAGLTRPILVAGVGSGLSAAGAVAGGADLLAVYNTAVYRQRNLPSILAFLPGDDPNRITAETAPGVVANAAGRPVIVGMSAHNPQADIRRLLDTVEALGGAGVTNEPFAGLYGAAFNAELERAGCGFSREVTLVEGAVDRGLLGLGWACDPAQVARMAGCGAQLVGLMLGITQPGGSDVLDKAARTIDDMASAARQANPRAKLLVHGGPLESPEAVGFVLSRCDVDGYVTGSSLERGPVIAAVSARMRNFRELAKEVRSSPTAQG